MRILITGGSGFIGTALISHLKALEWTVCNLDTIEPPEKDHLGLWEKGSVINPHDVHRVFSKFQPTHLVHLAAETSVSFNDRRPTEEVYPVNSLAVKILKDVFLDSNALHSVFTSTQYVCGPEGGIPQTPTDFSPHTQYGESKVEMEKQVRSIKNGSWTIIRPTYVWGPGQSKNFTHVFNAVSSGKYLHPMGKSAIRCYASIDTIIWSIVESLQNTACHGKVIYGTDKPEDSGAFLDRLSNACRGRPVKRAPKSILWALAKVGDIWKKFPMNSFRYYNMTTDYLVPYEWLTNVLGEPPTNLKETALESARYFLDDNE